MRLFLFIGIFLTSFNIFGQFIVRDSYKARMDSLAMVRLDLSIKEIEQRQRMLIWKPNQLIKISIRTRLNYNVMQKLDFRNGFSNILVNLETDDYISLGTYDIRCKVYMNKSLYLLSRIVVTGINTQTYYYYYTGFILNVK